jgi:hypothetical protein
MRTGWRAISRSEALAVGVNAVVAL